jgi:LacI family transcriptional regulator
LDVQPFKDRRESFIVAAEQLGLDVVTTPAAIRPTFDEGLRLVAEHLASGDRRFTAVFAHNDGMAMGAVRALREVGLVCPKDVSVVGYNDVDMADCLDPPLTTVRLDGYEVGRQAGAIALSAIGGSPVPRRIAPVPAELIVRSSTARPPGH